MNGRKNTELNACPDGMIRTLPSSKNWPWNKVYYNLGLAVLALFGTIIILLLRESIAETSANLAEELMREEKPIIEAYWNYTSYNFKPNISDWDQQRTAWMEANPTLRQREGEGPKVWMATDSSPYAREPFMSSHLLLKATKNKLDYCRIHHMQLYFSMSNIDPEFTDWWTKLPVIRMLMLHHPEVEWIWWVDSDAVFTDMTFVPPFAELTDFNLILNGEDRLVYTRRERNGASTASFLIRNCQWSLDLIDIWASMGTVDVRKESGAFQSQVIFNRSLDFPGGGDDQSGLVAILAQEYSNLEGRKLWIPKVHLVKDSTYSMTRDWEIVTPELEKLSASPAGGNPKRRKPLITHFAGCLPGSPEHGISMKPWDECFDQADRTFDFADNQVYDLYGFRPNKLGNRGTAFVPKATKMIARAEAEMADGRDFFIPPKIFNWDEQRRAWMKERPWMKKDQLVLISGSGPKPCDNPVTSHLLLRAFKNKLDYARMHDIEFFYNMALVHQNLTGWWSKIPVVRMMMLENPGVEWFWWSDSDAIVTDLSFEYPFARYNQDGINFVMYGDDYEVYYKRNYAGINAGNFLIRNCQWTLDIFDSWASFGITPEVQKKNGYVLSGYLDRSNPEWPADDQSVLVYILLKEQEKWGPQVQFEGQFAMSGEWSYCTSMMVDEIAPQFRPFITHFAGCQPCNLEVYDQCLIQLDRALNFADNQALEIYGFRHENLSSREVLKFEKVPDVKEKESPAQEEPKTKNDVHTENLDSSNQEIRDTQKEESGGKAEKPLIAEKADQSKEEYSAKEGDTPKEEAAPKEEDAPKVEDSPKEEDRPTQEDKPKEEDIPMQQDTPKEENMQKQEDTPKEQDQPKYEENVPTENETPQKDDQRLKEQENIRKEDDTTQQDTTKEQDETKTKDEESPKDETTLKQNDTPNVNDSIN